MLNLNTNLKLTFTVIFSNIQHFSTTLLAAFSLHGCHAPISERRNQVHVLVGNCFLPTQYTFKPLQCGMLNFTRATRQLFSNNFHTLMDSPILYRNCNVFYTSLNCQKMKAFLNYNVQKAASSVGLHDVE